jgi:hypothetical protein
MQLSTDTPALALKLKRGSKQSAGLEILDAKSGRPVAIICEGEFSEEIAQLLLASPDLLYGVLRAATHLHCDDPSAAPSPERRKICKLLRELFTLSTKRSASQRTQVR